jgi:hypothetical protein
MLAAAIVGGLGWCAGAVISWRLASARPPASRADVMLFLLGAVAVLWLSVQAARSVRYGNFGPMIDNEGSLDEPLLPVISMAYLVNAIVVAMTLVGLAASRLVAAARHPLQTADRAPGRPDSHGGVTPVTCRVHQICLDAWAQGSLISSQEI